MRASLGIVLILATACGPTIGDACTTGSDCGAALCINRDFAPGGYCTLSCKLDSATPCPTGSICVADALATGSPACFRACARTSECRNGYTCRSVNGSPTICVGAVGF
jgi:hypothetical protein